MDEMDKIVKTIVWWKEFLCEAEIGGDKPGKLLGNFSLCKAYMNSQLCNVYNQPKQHLELAIKHGEVSLELAIEVGEKETEIRASYEVCFAYFQLGQYSDAIRYGFKCFFKAQDVGQETFKMMSSLRLCLAYYRLEIFRAAIRWGGNYLELIEYDAHNEARMEVYLVLANAFGSQNQFDEAFKSANSCLEIAKQMRGTQKEIDDACKSLYRTHKALQAYRNGMDDPEKDSELKDIITEHANAIQYSYQKCIVLAKEGDDTDLTHPDSYIAFCLLFNKFDDAIEYCVKCRLIATKSKNKEAEKEADILLIKIYKDLLKEYREVIPYCHHFLEIAKETGNEMAEMSMHLELGNVYYSLERYESAVHHGQLCLQLAKRKDDKQTELQVYLMMLKAFHKQDSMENVFHLASAAMKLTAKKGSSFEYATFKIEHFWYDAFHFMPFFENYLSESQRRLHNISVAKADEEVIRQMIDIRKISVQHEVEKQYDQVIESLRKILDLDIGECNAIKNVCCLNEMAQSYKSQNKDEEAVNHYKEALRYTNKCTPEFVLLLCLLDLDEIYFRQEAIQESVNALEIGVLCAEAFLDNFHNANEGEKIESFDYLVRIHKTLAERLLLMGQHENALLLLEHCRGRELIKRLLAKHDLMQSNVFALRQLIKYRDIESLVIRKDYVILCYFAGPNNLYRFNVEYERELQASTLCLKNCEEVIRIQKLVNQFYKESEDIIEENSEQLRGTAPQPSENDDESSMKAMEILYNKLIGQLTTTNEEVIIVPDGPLCALPFAALRNPDTKVYLSEVKQIRLASSISALCLLEGPTVGYHSGALIIANSHKGGLTIKLKEGQLKLKLKLKELPFAEEEAKAIAEILDVEALTGAYAAKDAILQKLNECVSVIHIVAHGLVQRPAIVLSPSKISDERVLEERDCLLTMKDVQQTQVRAPLVVLSCCYSGRGKIRAEGVMSMCRAFLAAGARAVLASLWAIDDKATLEFMKLFYTHLAQGKSASKSLHLTIKGMKANPEYRDPKYWAPFFLMGDDVTINI